MCIEEQLGFSGGGAVWLSDTTASFLDCNFSFNATGGTGSAGAVWAVDSNLTIQSSFCLLTTHHTGGLSE